MVPNRSGDTGKCYVDGKHRQSYHKVAELIVQLGEIMEANGKINGRLHIIDYYKKLHSIKRAFKAELDMLL